MSPRTSTTSSTTRPRAVVTALSEPAAEAAITAATKILGLPTIREEHARIAEAAARERLTHKAFLAEVLTAECDDRDARRRIRRVNEAKFPRSKRLEDFNPALLPDLPPATLAHLASGAWIEAGEPLVLLGDSGTGKTHLLIALGTIAAEQGRRVRYVTTAALVNELAEAADERRLTRLVARYAALDLLVLDEVGYVSLDPRGAELLFQIITAREERASIACASNAPFSKAHLFVGTCARSRRNITGSRGSGAGGPRRRGHSGRPSRPRESCRTRRRRAWRPWC